MRFYRLTHPRYDTDQEDWVVNPVRICAKVFFPSVICPDCAERIGGGWASSNKVRIDLPADLKIDEFRAGRFLPLDEWCRFRSELARRLSVREELIRPGAQLGPPHGVVRGKKLKDILHPGPGYIWVSEAVMSSLQARGFTGVHFVKVHTEWGKTLKDETATPPDLWELVVTGSAWRVGMDVERVTDCATCGRTLFPEPGWLEVDESRWDGSDFFVVDGNVNITLVSERVRDFLTESGFSNQECIPVP